MIRPSLPLVSVTGKKAAAIPAFPSGLPESLEASVALQPLSEGSDSEYGSTSNPQSMGVVFDPFTGTGSPIGCNCKVSGSCTCCTPRTTASRTKRQGNERASPRSAEDITSQHERLPITRPAGLVVVANSGDFRPVLPRPQPSPAYNRDNSQASPSRQTILFSPYGRAYEQARGVEVTSTMPLMPPDYSKSSPDVVDPASQSNAELTSWWGNMSPPFPTSPTLSCGCGPGCACPGCFVHRGNNVSENNAQSTCANPGACNACLDCTILSLPASIPPDTPLSRLGGTSEYPGIDDWIDQVSQLTNSSGGSAGPSPSQLPPPSSISQQQQQQQQQDVRYNPSSWQTYALYSSLQGQGPSRSVPEECCGGRCGCPSGMCACLADCCGCCQGCTCPECDHPTSDSGVRKTLTFAVSGERGSCCAQKSVQDRNPSPPSHGHGHGHSNSHSQSQHLSSRNGVSASGSGTHSRDMMTNGTSNSNSNSHTSNSFMVVRSPGTSDLRGTTPATHAMWESHPNTYLSVPRAFDSGASSSSSRSSSPNSHSSSSHASNRSVTQRDGSVDTTQAIRSCCASMQMMDTSSSSHPQQQQQQQQSQQPVYYHPSSSTSNSSAQRRTLTQFDYGPPSMF